MKLYHRRLSSCVKSGNTWFRISWQVSPPQDMKPDYRFVSENKAFIGLANIIHEKKGISEELKALVNQNILECKNVDLNKKIEENIIKKFSNISTEPIYADEITEESLESANAIIFGMFFCSSEIKLLKFYQKIIKKYPLETVLKVLARMLSGPNEKMMTRHFNTAKNLFDKTCSLMNLSNKDIAVLTSAASDLARYPGLTDHQVSQEKRRSKFFFPPVCSLQSTLNCTVCRFRRY